MSFFPGSATLTRYSSKFLPAIEDELQKAISLTRRAGQKDMYAMLIYHMGWEKRVSANESRGKRVRPLISLLTTEACGADWQSGLPAAAAVELVHNFSLVHDDIQDQSPLRRGRPTVWKRWGVALAINAGDALFTLAHLTLLNLGRITSQDNTLKAVRLLQDTCLTLTQGQHLDLVFEGQSDLSIEDYWLMVNGKTAALIAASSALGALSAEAEADIVDFYYDFGKYLGLAFQVQDDLLGIWGDAALTGKSAESDLLTGKKSLPVIFGLNQKGEFARRWENGIITLSEIPALTSLLEAEGARSHTLMQAEKLTEQALRALENADPKGEAGEALVALAQTLLHREL
jgi:geranylgeranyl diphosphate synthase type I